MQDALADLTAALDYLEPCPSSGARHRALDLRVGSDAPLSAANSPRCLGLSRAPGLGFLVHHRFSDFRQRLIGRLFFAQLASRSLTASDRPSSSAQVRSVP
jgi:hypothetical protein